MSLSSHLRDGPPPKPSPTARCPLCYGTAVAICKLPGFDRYECAQGHTWSPPSPDSPAIPDEIKGIIDMEIAKALAEKAAQSDQAFVERLAAIAMERFVKNSGGSHLADEILVAIAKKSYILARAMLAESKRKV